ncbi:MAG: hypothetical protein IKU44_02010 [Firmicutes bacterium]|nr:hypothetical protein [Bacillota bacterium]
MLGKYEKIEIKMVRETKDFCLWKQAVGEANCFLETYKEKRAICFSATNLLPSRLLKEEHQMTYQLLLIGEDEGGMIHQEFGPLSVSEHGQIRFFQKFFGPSLACYQFCLFVTAKEDEDVRVLYRGALPSYENKQVLLSWEALAEGYEDRGLSDVFSADRDETLAIWYRIEEGVALPESMTPYKAYVSLHHHFILGRKEDKYYIGLPGRFLQKEQPCREEGLFQLWQPLRGGESYFDSPETMTEEQQERIFGYWIAEIDIAEDRLKPL